MLESIAIAWQYLSGRSGSKVLMHAIISDEFIRCENGEIKCIAVDVKSIEQQKGVTISIHKSNSANNFVVAIEGLDHGDEVSDAMNMITSACLPLSTNTTDNDSGAMGSQVRDNADENNASVPSMSSEDQTPSQTNQDSELTKDCEDTEDSGEIEGSEDGLDFPVLTQHSGHHDLSLVVFWGKQIEHILRKYFCKKLPHGKNIMLGRLIHQYSNIRKRDKPLTLQLQVLVKKRNMLVHKLNEKKFPNQQSRAEYIENCNIAMESLKIYSQQPEQVDQVDWPESFTQPDLPRPRFLTSSPYRSVNPELTLRELSRHIQYQILWFHWILLLLILWILTLCLNWLLINPVWLVLRLKDRLTPSHSCSILPKELEVKMKFHCWRIIKRGIAPPQRIKSVSKATFTATEVTLVEQRGNEVCKSIWLGKWEKADAPTFDKTSETGRRDFLCDKVDLS
ncbi:uncharacterized protein LOC134816893 [Bolinopsis microptera]|uniref:uncharacterized protein LOC134816893 n=1 Tax=Bolinopsis microptera TaxID=2820187 RepID=UPI00307ACA9C